MLYHEECSYEKHDGRKPASKQYVSALEQRVKELEALLAANGMDTEVIPAAARSVSASAQDDTEIGSVGIEQLKVRLDLLLLKTRYILINDACRLMETST